MSACGYTAVKLDFFSLLTVNEGEVFEPVYKKLKLATDAESDEEKPHLDIGAVGKS